MVLTHENIVSYVEYLLNLRTKSEKISIVITDDKYLIKLADKSYCDGKFPLSDIEQILSSYSRLDKVITNKKQEKCFVFTIFFFISGMDECLVQEKDNNGRFKSENKMICKLGEELVPIVDICINTILDELDVEQKDFYLNTHFALSHDIDKLKGTKRIKNILHAFFYRKFHDGFMRMGDIFFKRNRNGITDIFDFEQKKGFPNFWFILNTYGKDINFSSGYDFSKIENQLKNEFELNKNSIGVHYATNYISTKTVAKKDEIKAFLPYGYPLIGRAHYLMFDINESYKVFDKEGIAFDFTGGFYDRIGFRFGTAFPFPPYNFETGQIYNVVEVPLFMMDVAICKKTNGEIGNYTDIKKAFKRIQEISDLYHGCYVLLWHNGNTAYNGWNTAFQMYKDFISERKPQDYLDLNTLIETFNKENL